MARIIDGNNLNMVGRRVRELRLSKKMSRAVGQLEKSIFI